MEERDLTNTIAVCLSGQMRTAIYTADHILQFFAGQPVDFFIHTWTEDTTMPYSTKSGFLSSEYSQTRQVPAGEFEIVRQKYKPKLMVVDELAQYEDYYIKDVLARRGAPPVMLVGMFNSMYEANRLKLEWERRSNSKYRYVVKQRLDVVYDLDETLAQQLHWMTYRPTNAVLYTKDFMNKLPEKTEDITMIGTSAVMDIASDFIRWRETDPSKVTIDWQQQYSAYLHEANIVPRPWKNNSVYIYRDEHRHDNITPHSAATIT